MINLHRYYKDNKDDINSSIMELACDLAAARLMNEHGQPFESFVEADDPDDPEGGTHYKKEFQDEFDRYYDEQYDCIARLMRFDFNADDGVAHNNAVGSSEETESSELSPEHMETTCPVSEEDRQQVDKLKEHYRTLGKQGLELMRDIVSRFDDEEFSVEGYSVPVCDEDHDPCCVYGFSVKDGTLCASLDYDSGNIREVLVDSLRIGEIFDAFCELIENL